MSGYYYWINKKPLSELLAELDRIDNSMSGTKARKEDKSGAQLIYNKDGWKGYLVTTYEAMRYLGSGTQWCVAGSKRWINDNSDVDPETQGRNHFKSQLVGKGYYVLISPNRITWKVEDDNGEVNEFSGVRKYCIRDELFDVYDIKDKELKWDDCPDQVKDLVIKLQPNQLIQNTMKTGNWIYDGTEIPEYAKNFIINITIPDSFNSIGNCAFMGCKKLKNITIPNSVTSIGNGTFASCSRLSSITIPNSVKFIGEWAFHNCMDLKKIYIPNSITSIGSYAFHGCYNLRVYTKNPYVIEYCKENNIKYVEE